MAETIGPFFKNRVMVGNCLELIPQLPDESLDIIITSPPYWGQRISKGTGIEDDPREYLAILKSIFTLCLPKLKQNGLLWINIGDAYNTPVNWSFDDRIYSSLGPKGSGLSPKNSAYVKPRARRKTFIDKKTPWLQYGNLLALPHRLIIELCDTGFLLRGEVIWRKKNAMPEGRCRRPHRQHEPIYLFSKKENHAFRISPPVPSVWEFPNEKLDGEAHYSRFPEELPRRCIEAYDHVGSDVVVLDPFSGSGTTGIAAIKLNCTYLGFEIDPIQVAASNKRLEFIENNVVPLFRHTENSAKIR